MRLAQKQKSSTSLFPGGRGFLLLCVMLLGWPLSSKEYRLRWVDMGSDLPHNQINVIHKSSDGYMWFGTGAGLVRYDGYRFRTFQYDPRDSSGLSGGSVEDITEDSCGRLWLRSEGGRYSIYLPQTESISRDVTGFLHRRGLEGSLERIFTGKDGKEWYYLKGQGLFPGDGSGKSLLVGYGSLPTNNLTDIDESNGYILLTYDDGTVVLVRKEDLSVVERLTKVSDSLPKNHHEYFRVFTDAGGRLWIYGSSGTWIYKLSTGEWISKEIVPARIESLLQASDGTVWVGTSNGGVVLISPDGSVIRGIDNDPLASSTVSALYEDESGTVWIGTYKSGVAFYNESIHKFALRELGDINCIEEEAPGDLLLGTNDHGAFRYNVESDRVSPLPGNSSGTVLCMLKDSKGRLWMGKYWGGLECISKGRTIRYRASEGALASDNVWALAEDAAGNIWLGTLGGGVQMLNPVTGKFTSYNSQNSALPSDFISSICITRSGSVVVGHSSLGVSLLNPADGSVSPLGGESPVQGVNQVIEDSRSLVWIGTRSGLYCYDPGDGSIRNIEVGTAITPTQYISSLCESEDGGLWVTTAGTVVKMDLSEGEDSYRAKSYDKYDGLLAGGFNQRSVKRLSTGEVVFGGVDGVSIAGENALTTNGALPKVILTGFCLFDKKVEIGQQYDGRVLLPSAIGCVDGIRLRHRQNMFSVEFSSGEYTQPQKATLLYKLEGFDRDWIQASSIEPCATYTNLSPGRYTLLVKAINNDGFECEAPASLRITIVPPFWRTSWAYLLYALAIVAVFLLALSYIKRREEDKYKILQAEEAARRSEELAQMKLRFYTGISHDLRTPLTLIISPLEDLMKKCKDKAQRANLELMHRSALSLSDMIGQLLDFRKSEENSLKLNLSDGDVIAFIKDSCTAFMGITEKRNVNLTFYSPEAGLLMAFDKEKLGRIVTNLLSNAFKYTPDGGRVDVAVEKSEGGMLSINVSDTGPGIADEFKERIFDRYFRLENADSASVPGGAGIGLSLVREFTQLFGGDVRVIDNVPCGSVFVVRIPLREPSSPQPAVPSESAQESPAGSAAKPLALVVEDNGDLLNLLAENLSLYFRVITATDGQKAWELTREYTPDIVLTDIMMPVMDGNELCQLIKSEARTAHVPVMMLTARQSEVSQAEGLRMGADDYMVKPFNMEILLLRMRRLLEKKIDPAPSRIQITSLDVKLVEKATKYIEDNLSRTDLTVEDLSSAMSMSRTNLYKKLLRITGKTPLDFIRTIRLKRAAQLLRESQLSVSEIAYMVGYNNQRYFSTSFQKEFGVLPSEFKKRKL